MAAKERAVSAGITFEMAILRQQHIDATSSVCRWGYRLVDGERSVLLLAELLGLTDRVLELFDCGHLRAVQRLFRHVAPDRRRI